MATTTKRGAHFTAEFQRAAARARWDNTADEQMAAQLTAQAEGLLRRAAELRAGGDAEVQQDAT
jgi:hypothetical protein